MIQSYIDSGYMYYAENGKELIATVALTPFAELLPRSLSSANGVTSP